MNQSLPRCCLPSPPGAGGGLSCHFALIPGARALLPAQPDLSLSCPVSPPLLGGMEPSREGPSIGAPPPFPAPSSHPAPPASLVSAGGPAIDPLSGPRTQSPLTSPHTVLSPLSSGSHLLPPELVSTVTADLLSSSSRVSRQPVALLHLQRQLLLETSGAWDPARPPPPAPLALLAPGPPLKAGL